MKANINSVEIKSDLKSQILEFAASINFKLGTFTIPTKEHILKVSESVEVETLYFKDEKDEETLYIAYLNNSFMCAWDILNGFVDKYHDESYVNELRGQF